MRSNGKLTAALRVFALGAVWEERLKVVNHGIMVFLSTNVKKILKKRYHVLPKSFMILHTKIAIKETCQRACR